MPTPQQPAQQVEGSVLVQVGADEQGDHLSFGLDVDEFGEFGGGQFLGQRAVEAQADGAVGGFDAADAELAAAGRWIQADKTYICSCQRVHNYNNRPQ